MTAGEILFNDPVKQLVAVGKENTELHEEVQRLYREVDRYRQALTTLRDHPDGNVQSVARWALCG